MFSGVVALIAVYWFLGGLSLRASTYPVYAIFANAQKLDKGALVRMAGVKIGVVSDTQLAPGSRARVDMLIWKNASIPRDSVAQITQGGFIGDNYVEVVPGKSRTTLKPRQRMRSRLLVQPEDLLGAAGEVLKELKRSAAGINELLGDKETIVQVKDTIAGLKCAAESACDLADAARKLVTASSPRVERMLADLAATAAGARKMGAELGNIVAKDVRPSVGPLLRKADDLMKRLDEAVVQAQELLAEYKGSGKNLDQALASANKAIETIDDAAVQAKQMMAKLTEASTGIKEIATDPQIREDLKKTLRNAAEASEQAKDLVNLLNQKFGPKPSPSEQLKSAVPDYGIAVNALANAGERQSRVDAYYTFLGNKNEFYRVGGYSIGENTGVIAQGGMVLDQSNAFRYGVYASRIGVGYDRRVGPKGLMSIDWFRPNYGQLEVRGTVGLGDAFGLYIGVNDLVHQQNRDLLVGVRYRK